MAITGKAVLKMAQRKDSPVANIPAMMVGLFLSSFPSIYLFFSSRKIAKTKGHFLIFFLERKPYDNTSSDGCICKSQLVTASLNLK